MALLAVLLLLLLLLLLIKVFHDPRWNYFIHSILLLDPAGTACSLSAPTAAVQLERTISADN